MGNINKFLSILSLTFHMVSDHYWLVSFQIFNGTYFFFHLLLTDHHLQSRNMITLIHSTWFRSMQMALIDKKNIGFNFRWFNVTITYWSSAFVQYMDKVSMYGPIMDLEFIV